MESGSLANSPIDKQLDALYEDFNEAKKSITDEKQLKTLEDEFNKAYVNLKLTHFALQKKIHRYYNILM